MMKRNVRCLTGIFIIMAMLCGLSGCTGIDHNGDADRNAAEVEDRELATEDIPDGAEETDSEEESIETGKEASGEDLDVVVPDADDDEWYMKGNIYTDDKGNRLEVFFNDYGTIEFAVNGLTSYFTTVDSFQQENNWKVYTCDDGTMVIYYPGEPAHLEISDGDYAGLYECGGDKSDSEAVQKTSEEGEAMNTIRLFVGERELSIAWEDNESVDALRELVKGHPLSVQMSMYGGFEQVGALGTDLPRNDVRTTTEAGDIVLYSGNQIVMFYGSNSWAYTRLGRVTDMSADEMSELLGNGDVILTLSD